MQLGILGTGLMGLPMAQRLLEVGHTVIAYNRTAEKLTPLQQVGAQIAPSPQATIAAADYLILMLTDAAAIRATLLTPENRSSLAGKTVIQMGTIAPSESVAIRDQMVAAGGDYLEAPVLGSIPEAKNGTLLVMVGAEPQSFDRCLPILQALGESPRLIGPVGSASTLKLALNQLIGSLTSAFALSLALVQQTGGDVSAFMDILRQSALYAPTFDKKLQRMLDGNYENPNFPTKHLLKDMNLVIETARSQQLSVEAMAGVQQILQTTIEQGWADKDYSAIFAAIHHSPQ
ncbi:NAD(P)-dependent oxidoreductase [Alkalinema pantanalense CENA528]|uniref:NAD(P)-dependent oxidoreductase n=1 Tax=Alkalinema pantanalense TaxID=1620705 RepID=UPI003D6F36BF